jgi:hypothetical protein
MATSRKRKKKTFGRKESQKAADLSTDQSGRSILQPSDVYPASGVLDIPEDTVADKRDRIQEEKRQQRREQH